MLIGLLHLKLSSLFSVFKVKPETLFPRRSPGSALSLPAGSLISVLWRENFTLLGVLTSQLLPISSVAVVRVVLQREKWPRPLDLLIVLEASSANANRGGVERGLST